MQRLFSMFPNGWPGCGLLLLRASVGILVLHQGISQLPGSSPYSLTMSIAIAIAGLLLLLGVWTPLVGVLLAALEILKLWNGTEQPDGTVLAAAVALSIAMLGPGVWSVDAALFGRQRLEFPQT